jgi:hypothetical protein
MIGHLSSMVKNIKKVLIQRAVLYQKTGILLLLLKDAKQANSSFKLVMKQNLIYYT